MPGPLPQPALRARRRALKPWGALLLLTMGCIVRLTRADDDPLPNGDVTGVPADCSKVTPTPRGAPAGAAETKFIGRFQPPAEGDIFRSNQWSGSAISARFSGTRVSVNIRIPQVFDYLASIEDPPRQVPVPSIAFNVIIDDQPPARLQVRTGETKYLLARDLDPSRPHEITVVRAIEALAGVFEFGGFDLEGTGSFLPPVVRPRRIEVIGDSITCGYGMLGNNASCRFSYDTQDLTSSYAFLAGRALDAEVSTYCWSGRGVFRNNTGNTEGLIGVLYDRVLPADPETPFDFTKTEVPEVVVMLLGTNDFFLGIPEKLGFENAYAQMVAKVRSHYPTPHIFIALPPMLSDAAADLPRSAAREMLKDVVDAFVAKGDQRIYYMEFLDQGVRNGMGCDFHPNLKTHAIMAEQLAGAIRTKTCW